MKIEVNPNGIVKIDTDTPQALAGIFAIHTRDNESGGYEIADHTAAEIEEAVKASMVPVLFVDAGIGIVPCLPYRAESLSGDVYSCSFRGNASWRGTIDVTIDENGRVFGLK